MDVGIGRKDRSAGRKSDNRGFQKQCGLKLVSVRSARDSRNRRESKSRTELPEEQCISLFPVESSLDSLPNQMDKQEARSPQPPSHRWSTSRRKDDNTAWQKCVLQPSKEENRPAEQDFPLLREDSFDARFTPESNNKLDWGSRVEQEEQTKTLRYKRRLLLSQEDNTRNTKKKPGPCKPILTDEHKLTQRQKQIDIGKNTVAYGRYIAALTKENREKGVDPSTPDKFQLCSTRSWVGQIKLWRRRLHLWDPPQAAVEELFPVSSQSGSSQSSEETKMEVEEDATTDDLFKDFDLDTCLMNDGLPL